MEDDEIVHFIIIFFALGVVFRTYFPALFDLVLLSMAVVGTGYFVLGVVSRVLSGLSGKNFVWAKDWWHGLAILLMVGLIFGRMDLAVGTVMWVVNAAWRAVLWVLTGFGG